jgi:3-dehydroquinate dehydratase/shikimate dehydrogenase
MKSEEERQMLLRSAIAAGVEYIDLESDIAEQIPRYGNTKRIISYHETSVTPENLGMLHEALVEKDADIVKLATMANSFNDNVRMMNLVKNAKVPTIGICMGEIGVVTRLLSKRFGSPLTYATFGKNEMAPGQLEWKQMTDLYRYEEIDDETEVFGVIADPVAGSYSPLIHNLALKDQDLNARFIPFRVPRADLESFIDRHSEFGISGLTVTNPHTEAALEFCTQAETSAKGIGAINTMVFDQEDCLGYNTDYRAAMDCIDEMFNFDKSRRHPMEGMTALVLGAGGVTRAIAWGLRQRHAEVVISSRTYDRAQLLAAEIGCRAVEWELRHEPRIQLLVNGTPVGMHPDVDSSPYDASKLNQYLAVFDTIYHPESTLLIKNAKRAQCRVATGVDMFVRQAAYQYKLFTGRDAPVKLMRETITMATSPIQLQ